MDKRGKKAGSSWVLLVLAIAGLVVIFATLSFFYFKRTIENVKPALLAAVRSQVENDRKSGKMSEEEAAVFEELVSLVNRSELNAGAAMYVARIYSQFDEAAPEGRAAVFQGVRDFNQFLRDRSQVKPEDAARFLRDHPELHKVMEAEGWRPD